MEHHNPLVLLSLGSLHRKVDRLLAGQRRNERRDMHIKDLLDQEGVALDQLETDDAAVLAALANKDELTPDETAQAQAILGRIAALDAADVAALQPGPQPAPGGTDSTPPVDEGNPSGDLGDGSAPVDQPPADGEGAPA